MDRKRLLELINSPDTISQSEIAELFTLSQEYPYFQAVFALVAKTTQRTEDIQKAAIRTLHRSFLQKWMDNSQFNPNHQLPDLKGLDIRANQVNAFETLATITDQTHPHHLSVNISDGDQNKTVEIEVNFAKENTDKEQTALFEQEEKNEDLETYFHLAENPEKIDELVAQKAEEQLSKTNLPEDEIPNGDENSLRDYLQKAMEEIKQIKSSAIQKSEELASQSQATTDTSIESISSEVLSDAHTVSTSTESFVEPNYTIDYSYEEVDKFPYSEENNKDMPLFKENEIQELQKMVQSIQEGAQGKKEEKEPDPQEELSTYETTTLSLNPDFFELNQIITNQETIPSRGAKSSSVTYTPPLAWEKQKGIIDKFIAIEPQLKIKIPEDATQEVEQENLAQSSEVSRFQASENLAMILKRQGKFERAIQIYEDLILKYPEKRTYFAEQIEKIKRELS